MCFFGNIPIPWWYLFKTSQNRLNIDLYLKHSERAYFILCNLVKLFYLQIYGIASSLCLIFFNCGPSKVREDRAAGFHIDM